VIQELGAKDYKDLGNIKHHAEDLSTFDPDLESESESSSWNGEGEPPWPSYIFDQGRWYAEALQEKKNQQRRTSEWVKACS
jgi:hypothetical protein